jgi:hypothetical protein
MRGAVPALPNTSLWCGAQLKKKHRDNFTFTSSDVPTQVHLMAVLRECIGESHPMVTWTVLGYRFVGDLPSSWPDTSHVHKFNFVYQATSCFCRSGNYHSRLRTKSG